MKNFHVVALLALTTVVASFNANAASFDCAKASTAVEGSICANAGLSALDEQLAASYARARTSSANVEALRNAQMDWMKQRNTCGANVECLTTSYKLRIAALVPSTIAPANNGIQSLNGNWYSAQWKYGYTLQNGVGVATSTNSPNFQVGQNIIQLTPTALNKFSGQQVYTDGKFYNVTATLQPDGSLYFEGDKNVKWTMTRVGATNNAAASRTTESYEDGRTAYDAKDYANALRIFTALANANDVRAQNYIGIMHSRGLGVAKDDVQAIKWFQLAAANGFSSAQVNLGARYRRGVGTEPNFSEALKWLRLAAAQNNANAQFELGLMYQMGQGVATNDAEAIKWYQLAAAQGNEQAKKNLDVLRPTVATPNPPAPTLPPAAAPVMSQAVPTPAAAPLPAATSSKDNLLFKLLSVEKAGTRSCRFKWEFLNNTKHNITTVTLQPIFKENDGTILGKNNLTANNLKKGKTVTDDGLGPSEVSCESIAEIVFNGVMLVFVDGESRRDLYAEVNSALVFESNNPSLKLTSTSPQSMPPGSINAAKWKTGVQYVYYSGGSCTPANNKECMPIERYQAACAEANDITRQSLVIRGVNAYGDEKKLLDGGSVDGVQMIWGQNRKGDNVCTVLVDMSGIVNGSSVRKQISGNASEFIFSNNKLLVSQFGHY
jgi:TPR repeat protein